MAMNLGILALTLPLIAGAPEASCPPAMPAPFTFVKIWAPEGSKTTWHPQTPLAVATSEGERVGLRPGYTYRFELANVGSHSNATIWPSIEVRGALVPRPNMNVADHPIPIILSEFDIDRILEGRLLTKVYYLEYPDQSVGGATELGVPFELTSASEVDAIKEARARGRVMIIVRAGERLWTREELVHENVPGAIWVPSKMRAIPAPMAPPCISFAGVPLFDPILGQNSLTGECLHDGGDRNLNLGIGYGNKLYGLDPSDTSLEYNTPSGKKVTTSNRVCICVPRYAVQRVEAGAIVQYSLSGPRIGVRAELQRSLVHRMPSGDVLSIAQPINATGGVRPSGLITERGPVTNELLVGRPVIVAKVNGTNVASQVRATENLTVYPDCGIILTKRVDPPNPKALGEIVTFYLSYRNPGAVLMTNLVVSDNLTGRLEYIDGSAKSDRAATFTATANEVGSVVLRWAIDGKLLPGQKGVVSFQARIR
jgi:uncharacterized repeat protein (TIGR01451 family)